MPILRPARPDDAPVLSALALRSKAFWGYDQAFLDACRDELTWSAEDLERGDAVVAERDGLVVGFALRTGEPPDGELEAVFVDPGAIGTGVGRVLVERALARAAEDGFTALVVESDPNAERFYGMLGAVPAGRVPSGSVPGRVLPLLRFDLSSP